MYLNCTQQTDSSKQEFPTTQAPNYAHFARVLGIDYAKQEIYIENTLAGQSEEYWTIGFSEFSAVWEYPETNASTGPSSGRENVTRWAMVIDPSAYVP